jgi:predicted nucleotidyltransferase
MVFDDSYISPNINHRIKAELDSIEQQHGVRILVAVESGSRAWRFPSRDSDYDVRFIYQQPVESYLAVLPRRDVIERPIDATMDVNGWDLRKAMQLMVRSNAILLEWLCSPVRYRSVPEVTGPLAALARETADLTALSYHYDRQARRSFEEILSSTEGVRLKTYFYALRSAMALLWIRLEHEPPPMDLPTLMAGLSLCDEMRRTVGDLLMKKASGEERDLTVRIVMLDAFITSILSVSAPRASLVDRKHVTSRADALFLSIVLNRQTVAENP